MSYTKRPQPEAMLFDLDGTLFKSETSFLPAYHQTFEQLRNEGLYEGATPPDERVLSCLGMLLDAIWAHVLPDHSAEVRQRASDLLLVNQMEGFRAGLGELYPGVADTLAQLHRRGIRLFIASNGLEPYVKGVPEAMGIAPLFEAFYSAGEYQTASKVELVRQLLDRYAIQTAWMVGDRSSDVEAGVKNGLTVIGCDYACFLAEGELDRADVVLAEFAQLLELLEDE